MIRKTIICLLILCSAVSGYSQTLREALSHGDTLAALSLIKAGADVNAPDTNGTTELLNASRFSKDTVVGFLLRHGATIDKPRSSKGRTPLMVACAYYGGKKVCSVLINYGADVNAVALDGTTALMLAASQAKLEVVEMLLKNKANPNAADAQGKTALDCVIKADIPKYLQGFVKDCTLDKEAVIAVLKKATGK